LPDDSCGGSGERENAGRRERLEEVAGGDLARHSIAARGGEVTGGRGSYLLVVKQLLQVRKGS
jgi:hypothetical protein